MSILITKWVILDQLLRTLEDDRVEQSYRNSYFSLGLDIAIEDAYA
jgi:hypothetical protein